MELELDHVYIVKTKYQTMKIKVDELTKSSVKITNLDSPAKTFERLTLNDFGKDYKILEDLGEVDFIAEFLNRGK